MFFLVKRAGTRKMEEPCPDKSAFAQAEQAHPANKEKQSVPAGERPVNLIVCGFLQGASGRAHPVFAFSPLIRDFQTCYSYILSSHDGSLRRLRPHMPENQIQFARRTIH